jgi:glycogen debranching enzyme
MLAAAYFRWTGDLATMAELRPTLDAALRWIDDHGDADGDGFVEYERRSEAGLQNQGWKDSFDSTVHADGTLAEGPIALCEVQGYVYMAKQRIADVYEALGEPQEAERLRAEAQALRIAFDEAFWDPDEGTFALALDGRKRQVRSVTSNPAHCLYCDIVEPRRAEAVAERLMAPDMFSGWGIRTLSADSPAYNPMSYHNGSVWPHDNAIAAAGFKRYGFHGAAERVATALFDVGGHTRDFRLPELYCGFERGGTNPPVAYPVACIPQAWAAAVPIMLLQAMLGISARAHEASLQIHRPTLPAWLRRLELHGLPVGTSTLSLVFESDNGITGVSLLRQRGAIEVNVALDPEASGTDDGRQIGA